MTTIAVVSTAAPGNPHAWQHRSSVLAQVDVPSHWYAENEKPCVQNVVEIVRNLPADYVVIWLDGDDWFINENVVGFVRKIYDQVDAPWLTYGQFRFADLRAGWASEWPEGTDPRRVQWFATHLKTFRAGLFHGIMTLDLQTEGDWIKWAVDQAVMFPMLEMAGRDRTKFVEVPLCVYNHRQQYETGLGSDEWREAVRIRGLRPYGRLKERPW